MPSSSRDQRSDQLAYLSKFSHSKISSSEVGDLIEDSKNLNLSNSDQKNLNEMDREYKLASAIPTKLVEKISKSSAKCEGVWQEAREKSEFNLVKKDLEELINLTKEEANILGETFKISPYEALINKFEPSSEENKISGVFDDLQKFLTPLIDKIIDKQKKEETLQFEKSIDEEKQKNISEYIMKQIGFDFTRGRLDKSVHPFCGGSTNDVRITTRYNNDNPFSSLDGVMHETGHALYELNLPKDWMHQPAGKSRGMAMHESQSLLIEMQITRSLAFKKFLSNTLNKKFNIKDKDANPENLYKLGTRVSKSL
jgi:Zn-dependent carboxypeptidase